MSDWDYLKSLIQKYLKSVFLNVFFSFGEKENLRNTSYYIPFLEIHNRF